MKYKTLNKLLLENIRCASVFHKVRRVVVTLVFSILLTSCASVAVSTQDLEQRTEFALGLNKTEFSISNRVDSGLRTDFAVDTNDHKSYRCYVTGTISITGRVVSDAVCSQFKGEKVENSKAECNDLLRAAGKC